MLEKMKGFGSQMVSTANDTANGISTSVKAGAKSLANTATDAVDEINDMAVRYATASMCSMLEIAIDELKDRPLSAWPVSLTVNSNVGIAALEMQVHLQPIKDEAK
jgi:hypothetical protein